VTETQELSEALAQANDRIDHLYQNQLALSQQLWTLVQEVAPALYARESFARHRDVLHPIIVEQYNLPSEWVLYSRHEALLRGHTIDPSKKIDSLMAARNVTWFLLNTHESFASHRVLAEEYDIAGVNNMNRLLSNLLTDPTEKRRFVTCERLFLEAIGRHQPGERFTPTEIPTS